MKTSKFLTFTELGLGLMPAFPEIDLSQIAKILSQETKSLSWIAKILSQEAKSLSQIAKSLSPEAKSLSQIAKSLSPEAKSLSWIAKILSQEAKILSRIAKLLRPFSTKNPIKKAIRFNEWPFILSELIMKSIVLLARLHQQANV